MDQPLALVQRHLQRAPDPSVFTIVYTRQMAAAVIAAVVTRTAAVVVTGASATLTLQ